MNDFRFALRQLRKFPGFTITVVLTLALGIGANTAIFTLVHAVLLSSLPVADPSTLYRIGDKDDCCVDGGFMNDDGDFDLFSYDIYRHFAANTPEFEQLAAFQAGGYKLNVRVPGGAAAPQRVEYVSGNYFTTFGVGSYAGRTILPADDVAGAAPVAVLNYSMWQSDFGANPSLVGSTVYVEGQPVTVVGIAPPRFFGDRVDSDPPALWVPLSAEPVISRENTILRIPDSNWLYLIGRVRRGVNPASLQAKLTASLHQWMNSEKAYVSNGNQPLIAKQFVVLTPAGSGVQVMQQEAGSGLRLLMWISGLVLLVACANVANLMLVRAVTRRPEISLRMAMGAVRLRLVRQMLTESIVLGCLGGAAGLAFAYAGTHMIVSLAFPDARHLSFDTSPSLIVLGFAFALSLLTGIVFGIVPAWITSKSNPVEALRGANRSTRDRASLPQKGLIICQAALSLVLLVAAGLMVNTLRNLEGQNFGIASAGRFVFHISTAAAGYSTAQVRQVNQQIEREISALPGVQSVGLALYSPLEGDNWGEGIYIPGRPARRPNDFSDGSSWDRVSSHFFETVGIPVLRGRGITDQDTATTQMVAVVNQTFVKRFFPNQDPIGQHFGTADQKYAGDYEIVGVVADAKLNSPRDNFRPFFFRPLTQWNRGFAEPGPIMGESRSLFVNSVVLRFQGNPQDLESGARRILNNMNPDLTLSDFTTLTRQVANNFTQERLIARLAALFGLAALLLASVGLYGVTAYSVARRTSEIGVRMALGANQRDVLGMVLRSALLQIAVGLGAGLAVALLGGRIIQDQLYGVQTHDPLILAAAVLVLALSATVAGLIPARRAASIEPMTALRME